MDNYEHEIPCPDNIAIKKFLWSDYFHDSKITDIHFENDNRTITMRIECCRDMEIAYDQLTGDRDTRLAYIKANNEKYIYLLTFSSVKYFHDERMPSVNDYINGRFKDTALLRKLSAETKHKLLHFRMQISDGFIDLIFRKFQIRKTSGRVNYSFEDYPEITDKTWSAERIHEMMRNGEYTNDFNKFLDLQYLYQKHAPELLSFARQAMECDAEIGDSVLYAAYLIGKLGDKSDLNKLLNLYFKIEKTMMGQSICRCSTLLPKRNIMDAIELIKYRGEISGDLE